MAGAIGDTKLVTKERVERLLDVADAMHMLSGATAKIATDLDERLDVLASQAGMEVDVLMMELPHEPPSEVTKIVDEFVRALKRALGHGQPISATA